MPKDPRKSEKSENSKIFTSIDENTLARQICVKIYDLFEKDHPLEKDSFEKDLEKEKQQEDPQKETENFSSFTTFYCKEAKDLIDFFKVRADLVQKMVKEAGKTGKPQRFTVNANRQDKQKKRGEYDDHVVDVSVVYPSVIQARLDANPMWVPLVCPSTGQPIAPGFSISDNFLIRDPDGEVTMGSRTTTKYGEVFYKKAINKKDYVIHRLAFCSFHADFTKDEAQKFQGLESDEIIIFPGSIEDCNLYDLECTSKKRNFSRLNGCPVSVYKKNPDTGETVFIKRFSTTKDCQAEYKELNDFQIRSRFKTSNSATFDNLPDLLFVKE